MITDEVKNEVSENLSAQNSFFNQSFGELDLRFFRDSSRIGFGIRVRVNQLSSIHFKPDVYTSLFYGNSSFIDNPALFNGSTADIQNYTSLAATLSHKKSGSYVGVGIYRGQLYGRYDLGDQSSLSNVYSSIDNSTILSEVCFQTSGAQVKSADSGLGIGLIGGVNVQKSFGSFSFEFADVGWIQWKDVETRDTSGSVCFNGINWNYGDETEFNDLLDQVGDSLIPFAAVSDESIMLPAKLEFQYFSPIYRHFSLTTSLSHRFFQKATPVWSNSIQYHMADRAILWASISLTGNDIPVGYGLGAQLTIWPNTLIALESRFIAGLLNQQSKTVDVFFQLIQRI